jgi:small subunit ribosomal protein S27Ae
MAKVVKKGKKKRKPHKSSKRWTKYKIESDKIKKMQRECPRCGSGIFLAKHKNRLTCGRCNYTEFLKDNH